MSSPSPSVVYKSFGDEGSLLLQRELFRECFPETRGTSIESEKHYFWKFHSFPGSISSYEFVAYYAEGMIGYYAALPYRYYIDGAIRKCGMVCDVMTHPQARGKGVFTGIGRFATDSMKESEVDFTTGYPIRPEVIPGHLKVGWDIGFTLPMYIKPLKSDSLLRLKKLDIFSPVVNFVLLLLQKVLAIFARSHSIYRSEVLSASEFFMMSDYEKFYERWRQDKRNVLVKDFGFLRWRTGAPEIQYHFLIVREGVDLVSVSVLRKDHLKGVPSVAILDLMVLPEKLDSLGFWSLKVTDLALHLRAEVIVMMLSRFWARRYRLGRLGFLPTPAVFSFILKKLNNRLSGEGLLIESNWHLMWIDSDDL